MIQKIQGWFDVKVYNDRQPRENWKLKADTDNIAFTTTFDAASPEAAQFAAHGKPYTDNGGNNRVRVIFKIGGKCRWYDENAQPPTSPPTPNLTASGTRSQSSTTSWPVTPRTRNPRAATGSTRSSSGRPRPTRSPLWARQRPDSPRRSRPWPQRCRPSLKIPTATRCLTNH